jgi:xanthine dehydrogenase YagS FAD-binding subunit
MQPFALSRADDPAKAISAHAVDPQLAFIAGGTDLVGLMKDRAALPERLLDINGLQNMARIEALPGGGVRIGALARMSDVAADTEVRRDSLSLSRYCCSPHPANCAIWRQSAATSCNALAAPIRDETDWRCNKRCPGSGCAALHGLNRNHAIFGWSESCVATNSSDLAVALAAMGAIAIVRGKTGERLIAFADFHRLPGSTPERDNVLDRGDLIVAIEVPANLEARASHLP